VRQLAGQTLTGSQGLKGETSEEVEKYLLKIVMYNFNIASFIGAPHLLLLNFFCTIRFHA
jgi:hypothetical protein